MAEPLPFVCPHCDKPFGFGDGAALRAIVSVLPFIDQATPCCGALITGTLRRGDGDQAVLEIDKVVAP